MGGTQTHESRLVVWPVMRAPVRHHHFVGAKAVAALPPLPSVIKVEGPGFSDTPCHAHRRSSHCQAVSWGVMEERRRGMIGGANPQLSALSLKLTLPHPLPLVLNIGSITDNHGSDQ
jgi:hypothetical protein